MKDAVSRKQFKKRYRFRMFSFLDWNIEKPNQDIAQFIQIAVSVCSSLHDTVRQNKPITDSQIQKWKTILSRRLKFYKQRRHKANIKSAMRIMEKALDNFYEAYQEANKKITA